MTEPHPPAHVPDQDAVARLTADPGRLLAEAEARLLERGERLTPTLAHAVAALDGRGPLEALLDLAHRVRVAWAGEQVSLESIVSGKTGGCPEDCAFCSQSSVFDAVKPQPLLAPREVAEAARQAQATGATEFCIVYAVRGPDERLMDNILALTAAVQRHTDMDVAVSAGILDADQAARLAEAGVVKYNHNLETARSFFPRIVTTHSWEQRWRTLALVAEHGMQVCSGGILGLGESPAQRAELALELAACRPAETPLNFLNPRPGTPLADREPIGAREALHAIALFRLVLPATLLRLAGGREIVLDDATEAGILGGVNGLIVGNYLTTLGRSPADDVRMLEDLRMPILGAD